MWVDETWISSVPHLQRLPLELHELGLHLRLTGPPKPAQQRFVSERQRKTRIHHGGEPQRWAEKGKAVACSRDVSARLFAAPGCLDLRPHRVLLRPLGLGRRFDPCRSGARAGADHSAPNAKGSGGRRQAAEGQRGPWLLPSTFLLCAAFRPGLFLPAGQQRAFARLARRCLLSFGRQQFAPSLDPTWERSRSAAAAGGETQLHERHRWLGATHL